MLLPYSVEVIIILIAVSITAAIDVWRFKVYNALTLPLLFTGLLYHGCLGGAPALAASLLGALFGFGVLVTFYLMGGMGAGDVKLMAAVGAWLGMPLVFYVFIASSLAAGGYALCLVLAHRKIAETWLNLRILWYRISAFGRYLGSEDHVENVVSRADRGSRVIPFAAMVAIGVVATFAWCRLRGEP